jgi:hypothetical protein
LNALNDILEKRIQRVERRASSGFSGLDRLSGNRGPTNTKVSIDAFVEWIDLLSSGLIALVNRVRTHPDMCGC